MEVMYLDIETGPQDVDRMVEIDDDYTEPAEPQPFDESTVRYGNLKDAAKRAAKLEEERAKHEETVRDFQNTKDKSFEDYQQSLLDVATLRAEIGTTVAIGLCVKDKSKIIDCTVDEAASLREFWEIYERHTDRGNRIIGFNLFEFDLPFLLRRSMILGVHRPVTVLKQGKFWSDLITDLKAVYKCGVYDRSKIHNISLGRLARAMGVGDKTGDGKDFWKLWISDREAATAYLLNDLELTKRVAQRMLNL